MDNRIATDRRDEGLLSVTQALDRLRNHYKQNLTTVGLRYVAKREGFLVKARWHVYFKQSEFEAYFKSIQPPPEGWLSVSEVAQILKLSAKSVHARVLSGTLKANRFGPGAGVTYIDPKSIKID